MDNREDTFDLKRGSETSTCTRSQLPVMLKDKWKAVGEDGKVVANPLSDDNGDSGGGNG